MTQEKKKLVSSSPASSALTNLVLDVALLLLFLLLFEPKGTGVTVHEWGGLAFGATIIVHLLLHWNWVVTSTRRFFQKMKGKVRFGYIINVAIFLSFTAILFSGLMISRSIMPLFGIESGEAPFWNWLHHTASDVTLLLVAVHIGLHGTWIMNVVKRLLGMSSLQEQTAKKAPSMTESR